MWLQNRRLQWGSWSSSHLDGSQHRTQFLWWFRFARKASSSGKAQVIASQASPVADWEIFKSRWRSFKLATNIDESKKVHQLLGCLDSDVVHLVYSESSSPEALPEDELLSLIQRVAVKPENQWVTREKLHSMSQDQGEPITGYAARLKGQARLCGYSKTVKCGAANCNTDAIGLPSQT